MHVPSSAEPLAGLKVAVTLPPESWFGGVNRKFADDMARDLHEMGAALIEVDIGRLVAKDAAYIDEIVEALKAFRPDVAIGLENCGYAILCTDLEGRNLFRDLLEIPTIFLWDHGVLQFCTLTLGTLPENPQDSAQGCIVRMRSLLDHPLFIHYSPDRGHADAVRKLGIVQTQEIHCFVQPAFSVYVRANEEERLSGPPLAFTGNLYLERARALDFRSNPVLGRIEYGMLAAKRDRPCASLWELVHEQIASAQEGARRELHLEPDSSFFWRFIRDEIEAAGTTHARLNILTSLQRECRFYGNFIEPHMRQALEAEYRIRFEGMLDCVAELPRLYRNTELLIDVVHPCYISGTSPKIASCFAAGGMALFDYRQDFLDAVGDAAELAMYRDAAHLNSMIENYLANPARRRAAARELQNAVLESYTFPRLLKRVLIEEPAWRGVARTVNAHH